MIDSLLLKPCPASLIMFLVSGPSLNRRERIGQSCDPRERRAGQSSYGLSGNGRHEDQELVNDGL